VIFTSDNGPWLGLGERSGSPGPLRGGKFTTLEGGMREPTIAWWPKMIQPNTACDAAVGNIDLLPTFAKLGGAELPKNVKIDGKDITPILRGKSQESPREAHFYFNGNRIEAVRSGPWKLSITNRASPTKKAPAQETNTPPVLYNLENDISEQTDVATQHPEVVERLQRFIDQMDADLGKKQLGPGVRPSGRVKKPSGLFLLGHEPLQTTESTH
jgi:arylsulfatase A-like enzyme